MPARRPEPRWPSLALAVCAAAGALAMGCAGAGNRYGCAADAGDCFGLPDGGSPGAAFEQPVVVAHDGRHNGFFDLAAFAGQIFGVYRHASSRGFDGAAQAVIVRSGDKGKSFTQVAALSLPGNDLRDPKLSVFQGKLLVSFTAWDVRDPTTNHAVLRTAVSDDGQTFTLQDPPVLPQAYGLSAWRPRAAGHTLLVPVWTADQLLTHPQLDRVALLGTGDGAAFALASTLPLGPGGAEPELLVRSDGSLLLTSPEQAAGGDPQRQSFCSATLAGAQQSQWECWTSDAAFIEGPVLYEWKGAVLLAGRHAVGGGRKRTGIWQVSSADHAVSLLVDLPASQGDTGAPGLVALDADHLLLSWYTTSALDPQAAALGHEPTELESIGLQLAADAMVVQVSLPALSIGR